MAFLEAFLYVSAVSSLGVGNGQRQTAHSTSKANIITHVGFAAERECLINSSSDMAEKLLNIPY